MIFISSLSSVFPYEDAEKLYLSNKKYLIDEHRSFKQLCLDLGGHLWAVYADGYFIGIIHFIFTDGKCFFSGFSERKKFKYISDAINISCDEYCEIYKINEIYSHTTHKHAKFALLRAGFTHIKNNLYRRTQNV